MPLPVALIGFVAVTAVKVSISILLNPGRTADDDLDSVYPDRPQPIDPNFPPENPNEDLPTNPVKDPIIYDPPNKIYDPPSDGNKNPIELPPRRLPIEGDDQKEIQTGLGDVFTIQEWIKYREFGKLLWNPLSNQPLTIRQGFSVDADQQFADAVLTGTENYKRWLRAQLDPEYRRSQEYLLLYNFWDGTAWVMPQRLKGLQGDLTIGYGLQALQRLGNVMSRQSKNCLFGVIDNVPNGYEVVLGELPQTELLSRDLDNLEIVGDQTNQELLGVTKFPVTVPKDLTKLPTFEEMITEGIDERFLDQASFDSNDPDKLNKELESLTPEEIEANLSDVFKEKHYQTIESLSDYISWQMRQLDGLLGAYPINILVEDNDLTTEGNQPLNITIPNIAEGLAELIGNMVTQEKVTNSMIDMQIRLLMELASNKKIATITNLATESIIDYLGFKIAKKETKLDFSFNPAASRETEGEVDYSEFLKPGKVEIAYDDYDDDTTAEIQIKELIEAARIIKGKNTRSVNLDDLSGLKSLFTSALDILNNSDDDKLKSKFEEWLEEFEDGFTQRSDIKDPSRPWGRDRSQRPRINKLNDNGK
ncbi:MAG: hypothetical protein QNJ42_19125 [Crocosphaera sp.]|nr:hypothetical protein [Crocosphaera sp.]